MFERREKYNPKTKKFEVVGRQTGLPIINQPKSRTPQSDALMRKYNNQGWNNESLRHSLAARGISTTRNTPKTVEPTLSRTDSPYSPVYDKMNDYITIATKKYESGEITFDQYRDLESNLNLLNSILNNPNISNEQKVEQERRLTVIFDSL